MDRDDAIVIWCITLALPLTLAIPERLKPLPARVTALMEIVEPREQKSMTESRVPNLAVLRTLRAEPKLTHCMVESFKTDPTAAQPIIDKDEPMRA